MNRLVQLADRLPFQNWRIARYLLAGGTATATNLTILFILTHWFGIWYLYSSIIATSMATVVSFVLQKLWTFQNFETHTVHVQFPLHVTLALSNIALNTACLYMLVEWVGLWYLLAQVISGTGLACMNYLTYKFVIFKVRP
jgi:dolichol-phosphate mannosyltransferase